jgi:hypothetical protein
LSQVRHASLSDILLAWVRVGARRLASTQEGRQSRDDLAWHCVDVIRVLAGYKCPKMHELRDELNRTGTAKLWEFKRASPSGAATIVRSTDRAGCPQNSARSHSSLVNGSAEYIEVTWT